MLCLVSLLILHNDSRQKSVWMHSLLDYVDFQVPSILCHSAGTPLNLVLIACHLFFFSFWSIFIVPNSLFLRLAFINLLRVYASSNLSSSDMVSKGWFLRILIFSMTSFTSFFHCQWEMGARANGVWWIWWWFRIDFWLK